MDGPKTAAAREGDDTVIVNIPLFKVIGLYQMADPLGTRICGQNAFRLLAWSSAVFILTLNAVTAIGLSGVGGRPAGTDDMVFQALFFYVNDALSAIKFWMIAANARDVWQLFDVSRSDYLRTANRGDKRTMVDRSRLYMRLTTCYFWIILANMVTWLSLPFTAARRGPDQQRTNVLDFTYPVVTVRRYNAVFAVFYVIEALCAVEIAYGIVLFDVFLMSFCWAIASQYDVVNCAFERFNADACGTYVNAKVTLSVY